MNQIFTEEQWDPENKGRTRTDIERDITIRDTEKNDLLAQYDLRAGFAPKLDDPKYKEFWSQYGESTEEGINENDPYVPFAYPVYSPDADEDKKYFAAGVGKFIKDGDMVLGAVDCFGHETYKRVCPHCHNPLFGHYGRYPVKFISVIGVTGAGKTVYLSQLMAHFQDLAAQMGLAAPPASEYVKAYVDRNTVAYQQPLPDSTPIAQFQQPLIFDVQNTHADDPKKSAITVVIYDLAGELFDGKHNLELPKFAPFVQHSDAAILLIKPSQFDSGSTDEVPVQVVNTLRPLIQGQIDSHPMAVCLSQLDGQIAADVQGSKNLQEIKFARRKFNAEDYNQFSNRIFAYIKGQGDKGTSLRVNIQAYKNYNYFGFSATGVDIGKVDGKAVPLAHPSPKRIIEPIAWILHQFGFIPANGDIKNPHDWDCVCAKGFHHQGEACDDSNSQNYGICHKGGKVFWTCMNPNGSHYNELGSEDDMDDVKVSTKPEDDQCSDPKCKYFRDGSHKNWIGKKVF
ncbi:MAG: hypothetical protein LKI26_00915 [Bifidobacterium tibiigranuli]|jgi:hypothetical protein|uniref:TRAFAC clade GTPase domain-containing protein n=1 Tax=Bifidobacterium tibiigranuli TaxID=2172043 RepID=UPI0026F00597|nr:hypothetical protein [Bifidobacterium tibiigranuli]MCI1649195.1 hypothetical protein [Bifidobacterium tibiigranuli]MCI2185613.1 hypothetical protein [Bifidobacterium tibiigranuli]